MAYIDNTYYTETFHGVSIPSDEFDRLADVASDVIDSVVLVPIVESSLSAEYLGYVKKATAYELELLYQQGGLETIVGLSLDNTSAESLGGHTVTLGGKNGSSFPTVDGIPVSRMAIAQLKKAGLMSRLIAEDIE